MTTPIPPETAAHVLHFYGQTGGKQPGTFTEYLLYAIAHADLENTAKLAEIYPSHVAAMTAAQYDPDGLAALQKAVDVKLRCVRCGEDDDAFGGTLDQPVCEGCIEKRGAA